MTTTKTPRKRPAKMAPPAKKRPEPVKPQQIDRQAFKIRHLLQLNAQLTEQNADLQATNAELMEFIRANAELLDVQIQDGPIEEPQGEPEADDLTEEV